MGERYRLVSLLGEGQSGRVYRAERTDLAEHHVALKMIDVEVYAGRDPERELRLLSAVAHPNIVQLADHGVERGYVWFTMPLYAGEPLDSVLARQPLSPRDAHDVFAPIAEGLEVLHAVGLRHQDVKPENIFLASFQRTRFPLLLDLGAAAPARAPHPLAGTLLYAAPEQVHALLACVRGEPTPCPLDESVDVYGLAATLLRSLVGEAFFPGSDADQADDLDEIERRLERAALERAAQPLRPGALASMPDSAREDLAAHLADWMALNPAKRPSMKQLRAELSVLLAGEHVLRRRRQLRRAAAWAIGASALLATGVALWKREQDRTLDRCTTTLESTQKIAIANVSDLGQCKVLLSNQSLAAQSCQSDLAAEQQRAHERASRKPAEGNAWQARFDRCESERKASLIACNADIEQQVQQQIALTRERNSLQSDLDACRSGPPRLPLASSAAPARSVGPAPALPRPDPEPRPRTAARRSP